MDEHLILVLRHHVSGYRRIKIVERRMDIWDREGCTYNDKTSARTCINYYIPSRWHADKDTCDSSRIHNVYIHLL